MTLVESIKRWTSAMEDIEDPRGAALRQLHARVDELDGKKADPLGRRKRGAP